MADQEIAYDFDEHRISFARVKGFRPRLALNPIQLRDNPLAIQWFDPMKERVVVVSGIVVNKPDRLVITPEDDRPDIEFGPVTAKFYREQLVPEGYRKGLASKKAIEQFYLVDLWKELGA